MPVSASIFFILYMWSRLDHHWSNVHQQDHRSGCLLQRFNLWPKLTILQTDHFAKPIAFTWAIALVRWPIFKNVSFFQYLVFFRAAFCTKQLSCACRIAFRMFLAFLICQPNWPFCKAYSLYMGYNLGKMPDFQKRLISSIFGVFSGGFLHRTTLMWLNNRFSYVFSFFNLWAKLTILQSL